MKKIFLSFLAIMAMVGMVNAQRTWAYGLNMTQEGDNYTFVFKSTTAATAANLVFTDAAGEVAGKVALENVVAGENTKVLALADIPGEGTLNWAVELTGAAIEEVSLISSSNKIYFPQGVVANVNTESDYFGSVYVANAQTGTPGGTSTKQLHGIFEFSQTLEPINPTAAYAPSNLTVTDAAWDGYHRIAIDPTRDILAFAKWDAKPFSVYGMNLVDMNGDAIDLTPEVNQPTSLCYDENGVMYVLSYDDPTRATAKYGIHKVVDGVSEEVFTNSDWVLKGHNQIACDGHGGFWVASYASDASTNLHHVGKSGIDLKIVGGKDTLGMPANFVRGQLAYDLKRDVLAVAGEKKVTLYNVVYNEETGAPTLTKWTETQGVGGKNVDGVAFDYSGDLLVASASVETLFKYALPTENNTCTTPAKKAQVIVKEAPAPVKYTVTLENNIEQDSVYLEGVGMVAVTEGAGEYEAGEEVVIRARQLGEYYFIGWADENGEIITQDLRYVFTINEDVTYTAMYAALLSVTSTDLDLSTPGHLKGTDPMFQLGTLTIDLVLGEQDEDGFYAIVPETSVLSAGEVKFQIEEGVAFVDAEENIVEAMVFVTFEGQLFVFYIEMSAAAVAETIDVTIENATVNITEYETGFGGGKATELVVSADWVYEADGLTYKVMVVIAEFDPTAASGEYTASFFVQGEGDAFGMTEEAEVTVAIEGGKVIVTGEGIQAYNGNVYNLTISGTLPVEDEPATGVDNLNTTVAPVKMIENGQLIVIKDGVKFNAQGAVVK